MFRPPPLPRTLDAALRDVRSDRLAVRVSAARDLARHGGDPAESKPPRDRVIRALTTALTDAAAEVRTAAAASLADVEAHEALAALLVAVEDTSPSVRQMAITALGEIGDARACERLRRALTDGRPEVRFQAVIAYPRVVSAAEDAVEALLAATRDADPLVCHIALRMAEEIAGDGALDARLVARAIELLDHASDQVRVAAAILAIKGGARDGRAEAEGVIAAVARRAIATGDAQDEAAALELAGELALKGAREGLEKRAFGGLLGFGKDRFAWHAKVALARMGDERAAADILRDLDAWDRDKRTLAVAAAGRARLTAAKGLLIAMRGDESRADPDAVDEALAALSTMGGPEKTRDAELARPKGSS